MQQAGEICKGCEDRWKEQGKAPRILQSLPAADGKGSIPVCPFCDGPIWEAHCASDV